jgi:hypothetical protein
MTGPIEWQYIHRKYFSAASTRRKGQIISVAALPNEATRLFPRRKHTVPDQKKYHSIRIEFMHVPDKKAHVAIDTVKPQRMKLWRSRCEAEKCFLYEQRLMYKCIR